MRVHTERSTIRADQIGACTLKKKKAHPPPLTTAKAAGFASIGSTLCQFISLLQNAHVVFRASIYAYRTHLQRLTGLSAGKILEFANMGVQEVEPKRSQISLFPPPLYLGCIPASSPFFFAVFVSFCFFAKTTRPCIRAKRSAPRCLITGA